MENNHILEFLNEYKKLDELCRQILSSDKGVSKYIEEMCDEYKGHRIVAGWERDYKQLKRLRWIRNRLVHETDSFVDNLIEETDVEWLQTFYRRIMDREDPFALLYQSEKMNKNMGIRQESSDSCLSEGISTKTESRQESPKILFPSYKTASSGKSSLRRVFIITGCILTGAALLGGLFFVLSFLANL